MSREALDLMERALASPYGIRLAAGTQEAGWGLRKRIYHERDRQRRRGSKRYDSLSIVMKEGGDEIWIIRREQLPRHESRLGIEESIEPLNRNDLPRRIVSRGKSRPGIISPLHSAPSRCSD